MAETESKFLELTMNPFPFITYEDVVDTTSTSVPDSKTLDGILEKLKSLLESAETRSAVYDRGMRLLAQKRKDAMETERLAQEQRDRDAADEAAERGKHSGKMRKRKDSNKLKEERPLTHGAHGVAPQDGKHFLFPISPRC
jgi:transcriptional adapter 3